MSGWGDLLEGFRTVLSGDRPELLLRGTLLTLEVSLAALAVSLTVGTLLGLARFFRVPVLEKLGNAYVEIIRGIPLIVQLSMVYFGLTSFGIVLPAFAAATLALGLYSAAYVSEIVRGGLLSVPGGQIEAARSLGLSAREAVRFVVLPQAWRVALPALGNEYVSLILGSSLASVVTLQELFAQAGQINGATYRYFEVFTVTGAIYFVLTFGLTRVLRALERRLSRGQAAESAGPRRVI